MKHFLLILLLTACSSSIPANADLIAVEVVNNSILPHKYTFIGYEPGQTGNWTRGIFLLPGASHTFRLPLGTKVYRASKAQVGTVMGGGNIITDEPLFVVGAKGMRKKLED